MTLKDETWSLNSGHSIVDAAWIALVKASTMVEVSPMKYVDRPDGSGFLFFAQVAFIVPPSASGLPPGEGCRLLRMNPATGALEVVNSYAIGDYPIGVAYATGAVSLGSSGEAMTRWMAENCNRRETA
jgi:hypothetical protein